MKNHLINLFASLPLSMKSSTLFCPAVITNYYLTSFELFGRTFGQMETLLKRIKKMKI
jgi:hypothetical protein